MKKILIGLLLLFAISSTAYATNNQIVSIIVNGKQVNGSGQIIDGSTMLPIRAVAEALGADIQWDGAKKQASVTMAPSAPEGLTLAQLNEIGESVLLVTALDASEQPIRSGSGFIVNGNVMVTNHHVIDGSSSLKIVSGMKETIIPSNYLFDNAEKDLAAVKVDGYPSLKLSAKEVQKGDTVYSLGYPFKKFQISEGIVHFMTITGDISHSSDTDNGSSGGPLTNADGEVVGVTYAATDGTPYNNAIPLSTLQALLDAI